MIVTTEKYLLNTGEIRTVKKGLIALPFSKLVVISRFKAKLAKIRCYNMLIDTLGYVYKQDVVISAKEAKAEILYMIHAQINRNDHKCISRLKGVDQLNSMHPNLKRFRYKKYPVINRRTVIDRERVYQFLQSNQSKWSSFDKYFIRANELLLAHKNNPRQLNFEVKKLPEAHRNIYACIIKILKREPHLINKIKLK